MPSVRVTTGAVWPVVAVVALMAADASAQRGATAPSRSAMRQERAFAAQLQDAVRAQDRNAVAELVRYPARVSVHLRPFPIYVEDRAALLQMYDAVFTPQLRCAIATSREPSAGEAAPQYTLLVARGVVSLAGGRIIAERSGRGMLVTRLTSFGDTSTRGGKPRQVTFDGTRREIQLAGRVAESGADVYVVAVQPRERVEARIEGFPAGRLELRVARTGSDYRVDVVRRAKYCEPPIIPYLVTFMLNR
jgi:hypothetical protein